MSLQEINDFCEQQRERLHQAISQIIVYEHWNCAHEVDTLIANEYEHVLHKVDESTRLGVPWHAGIANMVRIREVYVQAIVREIEGDE